MKKCLCSYAQELVEAKILSNPVQNLPNKKGSAAASFEEKKGLFSDTPLKN